MPRREVHFQTEDCSKEIKDLQLAAKKGDRNAQFGLGVNFFNGQGGLTKIEKEAVRLPSAADLEDTGRGMRPNRIGGGKLPLGS